MHPKDKLTTEKLSFAIAIHQQGRLDEAEKIYREVLKMQPSNPNVLHFFGVLLHQIGQSSKAIQMIQRALSVNPNYLDAQLNLGNILKETGDMTAAAGVFRKVIAIAPDFAQAHNNLGIVLRSCGEFDESIQCLQRAIELAPQNPDYLHNLGNSFRDLNEIEKAVDAYQRSIYQKPDQINAYESLWKMLQNKGLLDAANEVLAKWVKNDPENEVARHYSSACAGGNVPDRATDAYIQETFDKFAASFDHDLMQLDYRAPELVGKAVSSIFSKSGKRLVVLDAGCGTGLCGPFLKPYAKRLIGVDLSSGMLNKAKGRMIYSELVEADLVDYLIRQEIAFDLIVSADTLCYFGNLIPFLHAARNRLQANGYLIFTLEKIESSQDQTFRLNPHGRYSHNQDYVIKTLEFCGLNLLSIETVVLRQESGKPVAGLLISAALKPTA